MNNVFIGAVQKDKKTVTQFYTNKKFTFKEVFTISDIPKNARYFTDVWTIENNENELYQIYRTPAGVLYGKKSKL
jgi:hypothetical protein